MESNDSDSSTSDEEYVPPTKLTRTDDQSDDSSDDENESEENDLSGDELEPINKKRSCSKSASSNNTTETVQTVSETDKKEKEDAVWNDFLSSVEQEPIKQNAKQYVEVSRKYQFAGEEIRVTERVAVDDNKEQAEGKVTSKQTNGEASSPIKKPCSTTGTIKPGGLSSALNKLKSLTGSKAPKLSTLEKSRMDWENFVRAENIEDDLKAHNKGKQGYLERRAFMDRSAEREYAYQKSQTNRKI